MTQENTLRIRAVKEAQSVAMQSKQIYAHSFWGEAQFNYIGKRGYVVVDMVGNIRGYYYQNPNGIQKAVEGNMKIKKNGENYYDGKARI